MRKEQIYKIIYLLFLNLAITSILLLLLNVFNIIDIDIFLNKNILLGTLIASLTLSIFYKNKLNNFNNRNTRFIESIFETAPYFFLSVLIILAINQFLKLEFLTERSFVIVAVGIAFGFLAFYKNRDRVEKELEDEKQKEERAEQQRYQEFSHRFPRISRIWGLRSIVRWMYKEGFGVTLTLASIILIGFALRLILGHYLNPDLDQGQLVYDAHLINKGLIPFKDFTTRAPLLVWILSIVEKITGHMDLLNATLIISLLFSVSTFILYFLSKELFSKKISLIVISIFNIVPLIFHYSYVLHVGQAATPFFIGYCLFMLKYIKENKSKYVFIAGLLIGLGYLVRRDLLMFGLPSILAVFLVSKNKIKHSVTYLIGLLLGLTPIVYLILQTNLFWINNLYGIGSIFNQVVFKESSTLSSTKWGIIANYLLSSLLFIVAFISSLLTRFKFKGSKFILAIILFLTAIFIYSNLNKPLVTGGFNILNSPYLLIYSLVGAVLALLVLVNYNLISKEVKLSKRDLFLYSLLFYFYLILGIFTKEVHSNYFIYTYFIIILFSTHFIYLLFNLDSRIRTRSFIIFSLVLFILVLNFDYAVYSYERSWDKKDIIEVNNFIENNIIKEDKVFTVAYTLVVDSNREIFGNITHHRVYDSNDCPYNKPYKLTICLSELDESLKNGEIDYIIMDQRTAGLINSRPYLKITVEDNFVKIKEISSSIQIYKFEQN